MTTGYAHIKDGKVINISNWDGVTPYNPGDGVTMVLADANTRIGGTYDGSFHYVEPTPPDPTAEQVASAEARQGAVTKLKALGLNDAEVAAIVGAV
tara:strand:+ start:980 stop:1267 length:288 start_codon:yes stop_codon:yes gene_type:complete